VEIPVSSILRKERWILYRPTIPTTTKITESARKRRLLMMGDREMALSMKMARWICWVI
jgi:hypothetical protein